MADPLSIASGIAGLVSLTIQATQLACKYVAEVSHAGEAALQCLHSLSLLRDVLERMHESEQNEVVASIITRKSDPISSDELDKCTQSVKRISQQLQELFHDDGKVRRRKALIWPFQSSESANLTKQLRDFRDNLASVTAADSLEISAKSYVVVSETHNDVQTIKINVESVLQDEEARKFLAWINPDDTEQWRFGSHTTAPVGDGSFFLDSTEFQSWFNSSDGILWTHGSPGSGKSVLMSQAISHLKPQAPSPPMVLSHFCDHRDPRTQSPELVVRHLVKQAALQSAAVLEKVQTCPEYLDSRRSGRNPRMQDAQRILLEVCLTTEHFVIVIDGLDECAGELDGLETIQHIMQLLTMAASKAARILAASRYLADIEAGLGGHCSTFGIRAPEANLRAYVASRLAGLEKRMPSAASLKSSIVDKIVADADGIFLLARLALDILAPSSVKNLRQIKKFLGEKCVDLSAMYQATYSRIKSSDATSAELAQRVLLWICFAQRPLHEIELQHAVATELEDEDFDPDGITTGDLLRSSCMGLVERNDMGMYSLFHMTAYEYFRNNSELSSDTSHLLISRTCLTYLSLISTGRSGLCGDLAAMETRKSKFCLLDYAAKHSADHIRHVEASLVDDVLTFLDDDMLRQTLMQAFYHQNRDDEYLRRVSFDSLPSGSSPLQVACGRGLVLSATKLLERSVNPKEADLQGWTPLIAATSYGQIEVVKLLLSQSAKLSGIETSAPQQSCDASSAASSDDGDDEDDANRDIVGLNQPDNDGWSPIFWAIIKNRYHAAELLLAAGASVDVQDSAKWTPIEWAAFRADRAFVDLILRFTPSSQLKGPKTNICRTNIYRPQDFSPLFLAAAAGDHQSVHRMLEFGFQTPTSTEQNLDKLFKVLNKREWYDAARYRTTEGSVLMPSLIETDDFSTKLLESAIRSNQPTIVKILIELGTSLGAMNCEIKQRTPLHIAACCGHHHICEYLLLKGASPVLEDADGYTAMDLAILIGNPQCTRVFLSLSPPPSRLAKCGKSLTAFILGLKGVSSGKFMSSRPTRDGKKSRNPRIPDRARSMLDTQIADKTWPGSCDHDTVQACFEFRDVVDVLRALLTHGCDLEAVDGCWDGKRPTQRRGTALHHACSIANLELVSFLIANGADVDRRDTRGDSPLHNACSSDKHPEETVRVLLQHGADPNALNNHGRSPLSQACRNASMEVVRCLVANGAVVGAHEGDNYHSLHAACGRRSYEPSISVDTMEIIDYIVSLSDPGILSLEYECETPLHFAIQAKNWEAVEYLQHRGATIKDTSFLTCKLWQYAANASEQAFRLLLNLGASPAGKCADLKDRTIIAHFFDEYLRSGKAASEGFEEHLQALIQAGADINSRSDFYSWPNEHKDVTVLRKARDIGLGDDFIQILLRHGASEVATPEGEESGEGNCSGLESRSVDLIAGNT